VIVAPAGAGQRQLSRPARPGASVAHLIRVGRNPRTPRSCQQAGGPSAAAGSEDGGRSSEDPGSHWPVLLMPAASGDRTWIHSWRWPPGGKPVKKPPSVGRCGGELANVEGPLSAGLRL